MDEREAIERLRGGDIAGLATLVTRYQTEATRKAQLITRDRALAEDVVQNALVRVYDRIGQYDPERPFARWFFRVVSNDAIKAVRRSSRNISLSTQSGTEFEQLADNVPGPDELLATLEQLTPEQRAAQRHPLCPPGARQLLMYGRAVAERRAVSRRDPPSSIAEHGFTFVAISRRRSSRKG